MEEVVIIADPKGKGYDFAKGVYNYVSEHSGRKFPVRMVHIERTDFKDGEFKVKIADNVRRAKCFFIHDSSKKPSDWFTELLLTLQAAIFSSPEEMNIVLPYTKFARQDRKDESRVSVNAKVLADTMSLYATRGMTVDLHVPQMQEYFGIPFDNLYSFPTLVNYLMKIHPEILENLVIVSPDMGGAKRVDALAKRFANKGIKAEVALGHKRREKENEVSKIAIIGDVENKNCIIIDDIIDTGNTLVKTAEELRKKGAKTIFAYAAHGLFTDGTDKFKVFDKVLISDTIHQEPADKKEIVSLVDLFGEAVYRTVIGESLSDLFENG